MPTFKQLYATWATITITANSLANAAARQGTAVDNTTNLYLDALVGVTLSTASGTLGANPVVEVWAYASTDSTPHYTDGATGSDAAFTMPSVPNMVLLGVVNIAASATATYSRPFSIASAFGSMPDHWGVVLNNKTGLALGASGNSAQYAGIQTQSF